MQDIVEESGMSRGGVYMYYANKDDIFRAILDENDEDVFTQLAALQEQFDTAWGALDALLAAVEHGIAHVAEDIGPIVMEVFSTSWREEGRAWFLIRRYEVGIAQFSTLIQRGVDSAEFRPVQPVDTIVRVLLTLMDGLSLAVLHFGAERSKMREQIASFRHYLRFVLQVEDVH